MNRFDANTLLNCYRRGIFPMAENHNDPTIFLLDPEVRGIIPLDGLHISRSLKKELRKNRFQTTYNHCFERVIKECAKPMPDRPETWINDGIKRLYNQLHIMGHAHSVEIWNKNELAGGLYGVALGSAFFGESMFSRQTNASKVALIRLVERLNQQNFQLLDTQFMTDHLRTLGGIEISRDEFHEKLQKALEIKAIFDPQKTSTSKPS